MPWILFRAPAATPDGRTAKDLYEKRLTWITDEMRADARRLGCRFHRAWYATDGSAFYALGFWESREGANEFFRKWDIQDEPGEVAVPLEGDVGLVPLPDLRRRSWPSEFEERKRGKDCPFCAKGRVEEDDFGARIFAGRVSDAYLQKADIQRGYTIVVWRGRHVAEPTQLSDEDAAAYWQEVLRVGRALERHFRPLKLNFDVLGNGVPHLHTHVVPRYEIDGNPGGPPRFMMVDESHARIPDDRFRAEVVALRALLG